MADIQSNINVNIDTSEALASIKALQRQISAFYTSMARSGAAANAAVSNMQSNLINTINQTGKFSATIKNISSTTEAFTTSLEKNKFSLGQYFRFAGGASKTFGKNFRVEMDTIDKVARERVKTLQTQYITMGREANGALKAIAVRPLALDLEDLGTKTAIAAQKQQIMNQLLKQGSTNLLNFGKNTQWAGRQLMVGFTIPLSMVGTAAAKTFMQMEEQAIKFKRVYGDSFTPTAETEAMVQQVRDLASEFTKYGVAAEKTMSLAATAAAAGKTGAELTAQVREANRLAVLGQVEQQQALETTISITNAFGTATADLTKKINFLNAVENQTVTSIEDLTIAVPKAGPVVKQLGGDVEDLAFFLTAMKEGGINASEGANALKSGLASLINPTEKASAMLGGFGINIKNIVEANKGNVRGIVIDFAKALDTLDPLNRARAIEQLFGKFQFSRLSTLFQNVVKDGTQASRVLELTGKSSSELAALASKELGTVAASSMFKFQKAVEDLKVALAPIGEIFLKLVTPVIEFGTKILENFNKLDSGAKNFITGLIALVGGLGPVLIMTFGLLANGVANIIKGFMLVRNVFTRSGQSAKFLGDETDYMTQQQLEAAGVAASLEQVHQRLEQRFTSEAGAVNLLSQALERAIRAQQAFQGTNTGTRPAMPKKYAKGVVSVPGPKGAGDIVPAMLAPGEAVVPAKQATKYAGLIQGIVADNIPGYEDSNIDVSGNRGSGFRTYTDFTALLSAGANRDLNVGQASPTDIARQFSQNPIDIQGPLLVALAEELGGARTQAQIDKFFQANPEVLKYGEQLSLGIAEEVSSITAKTMGDTDLYKAVDTARKKIKTSPEIQAAADLIATRPTTYEEDTVLRQRSSGRLMAMGRERLTNLRGRFTTVANRGLAFARRRGAQLESPVAAHLSAPGSMSLQEAETLDLSRQASEAMGRKKRGIRTIRSGGKSVDVSANANLAQMRAAMSAQGMIVVSEAVAQTVTEGTKAGAKKATATTAAAIEQGTNEAIQRNSPPKRAIQIGRDYGFALNGALRESIPKAKVAGEAFGLTATTSMTTVSPAMMQHLKDSAGKIVRPFLDAQGRLIPIAQQRVKILEKEAVATQNANVAQGARVSGMQAINNIGFIGPLQQSPIDGNPAKRPVIQDGETSLARFGSTVRNASFVLTSLAAAGTMAGGAVGDISNAIMQFSGVVFAATTVIDLMAAAERRRIAATAAATVAEGAQAKTGILSTIGNFLMFSKGRAGGKGLLATAAMTPLKGAFAAAGGGLRGFMSVIKTAGANILKFGGAALRFVPVLGWIITGLSIFALIIDQVNKAKERERLATEGVADATENTAEELNSLAEDLGKEKIVTAFQRVAQGADPTATGSEVSITQQLRDSQSFKDARKADIEMMRGMTQRELKTYQDTLGLSLQATGQYSKDEISAIVKALQLEAERTDVAFSFKSIDLTSKNADNFKASISRMTEILRGVTDQTDTQSISILNSTSRALSDTINSLTTALQQGVITTDAYTTRMQILKDQILALPNAGEVARQMLVNFTNVLNETRPDMAILMKGVEGASNQLFVMGAVANGAIPDVAALAKVIKALRIVADVDAGKAPKTATYDSAVKVIDFYTKKANEIATALGNANTEITDGVTGQKSAWQSATEELSNNIKEVNQASRAYNLLSKAGFSAADAFKIAQDPALATALATTKVGTKQWKTLVSLTQQYLALTKSSALGDALKSLTGENLRLEKFDKLSKYLQQMGLDSEEIQAVISDPELADGLLDATGQGIKGFASIDKYIQNIKKNKELKISIMPLEDQFKQRVGKVFDAFNAEENVAEIKLRIKTKPDQDIVRLAQQQIDTLNFQMDDFEAGLTRLEDQETAINEKYDNRIEALDKVIAANDRIAEQNKEELNIFQMVARGDISGAAAGIAQLQQQKTRNALEARKELFETQRKNELESLTAEVMVNGQKVMLTRSGIEENIKNIKQKIFEIEEKTLEPAQRRIDIATAEKDNYVASLTILGMTKDEWELIGGNIDLAKTKTTAYLAELQKALDVARQIPGALAGTSQSGTQKTPPPQVGKGDFPANKVVPKPGAGTTGKGGSPSGQTPGAGQTVTPGAGTGDGAPDLPTFPKEEIFAKALRDYVKESEEFKKKHPATQLLTGIGHQLTLDNNERDVLAMIKQNIVYLKKTYRDNWAIQGRALGAFGTSEYWKTYRIENPTASAHPYELLSKGVVLPSYNYADGGMVNHKYFAMGGSPLGTDIVPAMLTPGEFVVSKYGVENYGVDNLKAINNGTAGANSVYNGYNINVNVRSNSNPDQIANAVMTQIRQINAQQVRGNRL